MFTRFLKILMTPAVCFFELRVRVKAYGSKHQLSKWKYAVALEPLCVLGLSKTMRNTEFDAITSQRCFVIFVAGFRANNCTWQVHLSAQDWGNDVLMMSLLFTRLHPSGTCCITNIVPGRTKFCDNWVLAFAPREASIETTHAPVRTTNDLLTLLGFHRLFSN
jgi:hypothetical protein